MRDLLELIGDPGGDVLLFAHGHCLGALAAVYLEVPLEIGGLLRLDAGTLSVVGRDHGRRSILLWDDTSDHGN
jgi:probable phosphoglycerate mutase